MTVPVDLKIRLGKAFPGLGLPTGIIRHRIDDGHVIISLAVQQHWRRGLALVHPVLGGETVARERIDPAAANLTPPPGSQRTPGPGGGARSA